MGEREVQRGKGSGLPYLTISKNAVRFCFVFLNYNNLKTVVKRGRNATSASARNGGKWRCGLDHPDQRNGSISPDVGLK